MIWFRDYKVDEINSWNQNTMVDHCDISITEVSSDSLHGQMVVSDKIKQPYGIVHGGANCVLAETLGSISANLVCDPDIFHAVGLTITTNHLRAVRNGKIKGIAKAIHIGGTTHIWDIKTYNDSDALTSTTTLTMSIIKKLGKS